MSSAAPAEALVCDQCGATFSSEDALEAHRLTHTGTSHVRFGPPHARYIWPGQCALSCWVSRECETYDHVAKLACHAGWVKLFLSWCSIIYQQGGGRPSHISPTHFSWHPDPPHATLPQPDLYTASITAPQSYYPHLPSDSSCEIIYPLHSATTPLRCSMITNQENVYVVYFLPTQSMSGVNSWC